MNHKHKLISAMIVAASLFGCDASTQSPFSEGGGSSSGKIEIDNFTFYTEDGNTNPATVTVTYGTGDVAATGDEPDTDTIVSINSVLVGEELKFGVLAGDRFGRTVAGNTINFVANYGNYDHTCTLTDTGCTISLITNGALPLINNELFNGHVNLSDITSNQTIYINLIAYTQGEESFIDVNGNGFYDDDDIFTTDVDEPYIDNNTNGVFDDGIDIPIDLDNSGGYTPADGFYSGSNCRHTTDCSPNSSIIIWDRVYLDLVTP